MAENKPMFCFGNAQVIRKRVWKAEDVKVFRKFKRNRLRILRRKRNNIRYRARRKAERIVRKTDDLCSFVSVCDITDSTMQCEPTQNSCVPQLPEVADWHKQYQIAYWKSRALSVEYENRMLHRILRETQLKQIEHYVEYMKEQEEDYEERPNKKGLKQVSSKHPDKETVKEYWAPPTDQERREKQERMITLYGNMAPKISGMETAIQLNYDLYVEKNNPPFWPNIPMRL